MLRKPRLLPIPALISGLVLILTVVPASADLRACAATADITPPLGTPSAGYGERRWNSSPTNDNRYFMDLRMGE